MNNLRERLEAYIKQLDCDIEYLERPEPHQIRALVNKADAQLVKDIKEDLERILEVE